MKTTTTDTRKQPAIVRMDESNYDLTEPQARMIEAFDKWNAAQDDPAYRAELLEWESLELWVYVDKQGKFDLNEAKNAYTTNPEVFYAAVKAVSKWLDTFEKSRQESKRQTGLLVIRIVPDDHADARTVIESHATGRLSMRIRKSFQKKDYKKMMRLLEKSFIDRGMEIPKFEEKWIDTTAKEATKAEKTEAPCAECEETRKQRSNAWQWLMDFTDEYDHGTPGLDFMESAREEVGDERYIKLLNAANIINKLLPLFECQEGGKASTEIIRTEFR